MSHSMTGWMIWYMVEIGWTPVASLRRSIVFWLDAMARSDGIPIGMLTMWSPECMQSSTSLYFFTFYVELYKSWPSGLLQDFTLVFWQCLSWVFTEWTNCIDRSDLPVWWKPAWMLTNSMVHVWMYRMTIGGWDTDVSPRKHALWELAVEGSDMSVAVVWFACLGCTCKEQLFETCLVDGFEIYNEERILWEVQRFMKMKMEKRKRKKIEASTSGIIISMIFHPPSVLRLQDKRIKLEHQSFWILGWDYKRQKTAQILSPQLPCFWRKRDFTRDHLQDLLRPRLCQWNSFGPTNHFEILIPSKIYSFYFYSTNKSEFHWKTVWGPQCRQVILHQLLRQPQSLFFRSHWSSTDRRHVHGSKTTKDYKRQKTRGQWQKTGYSRQSPLSPQSHIEHDEFLKFKRTWKVPVFRLQGFKTYCMFFAKCPHCLKTTTGSPDVFGNIQSCLTIRLASQLIHWNYNSLAAVLTVCWCWECIWIWNHT